MIFAAGGPDGIRRLLDRLLARRNGNKNSTGYRRLLDWAEGHVERYGRESAVEPLIAVIERHYVDTIPATPSTKLLGRGPAGFKFLGVMVAAAELGVNAAAVHRLVNRSRTDLLQDLKQGRIPVEEMADLRRLNEDAIDGVRLAEFFRISRKTFDELLASGLLDGLRISDAGHARYSRAAAEEWLAELAGSAVVMESCPDGCVGLVNATHLAWIGDVIRMVAEGAVPVVGRIVDLGLRGLLVRRAEVRRLAQGEASADFISAVDAAALLGVSDSWVERRCSGPDPLFARKGGRGARGTYARIDVETFARSHRSLAQAVAEYKLPRKQILARLNASGVKPTVTGARPDGTWFRSADLREALASLGASDRPSVPRTRKPRCHAVASEDGWVPLADAAAALGVSKSQLLKMLDAEDVPFAVERTEGGHRRIARRNVANFVRDHVSLARACGGASLRVGKALDLLRSRHVEPVWRGPPKLAFYRRSELEPLMQELLALTR
ncbi:hypothetical protein [Chthonobacter rhizosphaerae]|uniref:hypothetical protein n=1 Tax=Chthonobacter rhizosphaerae TaxID=2735553 RepID=UPI0015EF63CA|nr:hypothetical protein [Chthonobacter rhizosphaerae]